MRMAFGQGVYRVEGVQEACQKPVELVMGNYNVGVRGEHFEALFSRLNGGLLQIRRQGNDRGDPQTQLLESAHGQ